MFKKFLTFLGALTFILLIFAGIRYAGSTVYGRMADKESAAYANNAVKAITANWNAQELVNRAHPALLAKTNPQEFTGLFDKIREIGKVKKLEKCEGQAIINYPSLFSYAIGSGSETNAKYVCRADFDRGPAALAMILHKDAKAGWQIVTINVDSPFFKPAASKPESSKAEEK